MGLFASSQTKTLKGHRQKAYLALLNLVASSGLSRADAYQAWLFLGQLERQHKGDSKELGEGYQYFEGRLSGQPDLRDWGSLNAGPGQPSRAEFDVFFRRVQSGRVSYSSKLRAWGGAEGHRRIRIAPQGRRPKTKDVARLLGQLSVMFGSGITLVDSLDSLSEGSRGFLQQMLTQMRDDLSSGWTLAASMKTFPSLFSGPALALIKAGESTGSLGEALRKAAELLDRQSRFRARVMQAVTSPLVIVGVGGVIVWGIVRFIIPKFLEVYEQMELELPRLSQLVIGGVSVVNNGWFMFGAVLLAGLGYWYRTPILQGSFALAMRLPLLNRWTKLILAKETCDILSELCANGVPIQNSFRIVAECSDYELHRSQMSKAVETLRETGSLSETLAEVQTLPRIVSRMAAAGEEAGSIESMLASLSKVLDQQIDTSIEQFLALVEPLALAVLGIGVAVMFVGLFLPIYGVIANL